MRLTLWLVLILSFSIGMCCAFAVRYCYFEAKPVAVNVPEQKTKILIAKRTIPAGIEITADFIEFQEVTASEVPPRTLSSFAQIYRRQPAYPIPAGCPLCEDLLRPITENDAQTGFVPAGSQLVTLNIVQTRQGNEIAPSDHFLSEVFSAEQRVDVRIISRQETQGQLANKKNEVLRAFASRDIKNEGELVLENVPVHKVQQHAATGQLDSLSLMLDKNDTAKLTTAARKGQIRILVHQEPVKPEPLTSEPMLAEASALKEVMKITAPSNETPVNPQPELPPLPVSIPPEPMPMDVPMIADKQPSPTELAFAAPMQSIQSNVLQETDKKTAPSAVTPDIFNPVLPPAPVPEHISQTVPSETAMVPPSDSIVIKERISIRNEMPLLSFGTPILRVIPEQDEIKHVLAKPSLEREPGHEALVRPVTESESFRTSSSIRFQPPAVVAKKEPEPAAKKAEIAELELPITVVPAVQEKIRSYSPFERRGNIAPASENWDKNLDENLPAPPRLLKSSRTDK